MFNARLFKFFGILPLLGSLFSCATIYNTDKDYKVNISVYDETKKNSGDFIAPDDVSLLMNKKDFQKKNVFKNSVMPSTGEPKLLVIPIDFSGFPECSDLIFLPNESNRKLISEVYFGKESNNNSIYRDVASFYQASSYNKMNLKGEVLDWYDIRKSGFTSLNDFNDLKKVKTLVSSIINNVDVDFKDFDSDKDGYIDGVSLVYNYYDKRYLSNEYKDNEYFWSYVSWVENDPNYSNPSVNAFSFLSYDFMYDADNKIDTSVFIHELGHLLGLNDYYDKNGETSPLGSLDMMDKNLFEHNSYSKMCLGWTKPYIVDGNCTINLKSIAHENSCVVILPDGKMPKRRVSNYIFNPFSEYLLIEFIEPTGYKTNTSSEHSLINSPGFRVFHVDGRILELQKLALNQTFIKWYEDETLETNNTLCSFLSNTTKSEKNVGNEDHIYNLLRSNGFIFADDFTYDVSYNEIQVIDKTNLYSYKKSFSADNSLYDYNDDSLFIAGDEFDTDDYNSYFINGRLNNDLNLSTKINFF